MISEATTSKTAIERTLLSAKSLLDIVNKLDGTYSKHFPQKEIIEDLGNIVSAGNTDDCMLLM